MYLVSVLHPVLPRGQRGGFFSRRQKVKQILDFYRNHEVIPLCVDHCNAQEPGFVVPERERVGVVNDLFINARGQMMVKLCLDQAHPFYARMNQGRHMRGEAWGVSMWVDKYINGDKRLSHVALTRDPRFAAHDTWFHDWGLDARAVDRVIAQKYYRAGEGLCFAAGEFKTRLRGMALRAFLFFPGPRSEIIPAHIINSLFAQLTCA
jgi:hypothetical protein